MGPAIFLGPCGLAFVAWCMVTAGIAQRRNTERILDVHREEVKRAQKRVREAEEAYQRWLAENPQFKA